MHLYFRPASGGAEDRGVQVRRRRAQGLAEYGLILALVSLVAVLVLAALGTGLLAYLSEMSRGASGRL